MPNMPWQMPGRQVESNDEAEKVDRLLRTERQRHVAWLRKVGAVRQQKRQSLVLDDRSDRTESDYASVRQHRTERLTQILLLSERTSPVLGIDPLPAGWIHSSLTSRPDVGGLGRWNMSQGCLRHTERQVWPTNPLCNCDCLLFHRRRGKADGQALV